MSEPITLTLHAETQPLALRAVRRMIVEAASACGASEAAVTELEVAVGEILSNARRHAYHGDAGPLEVDIRCDEEAIDLVVHDHGEPLVRAPTVPAGRRLAGQDGFGLYIASRLVDVLEIRHPARDDRGTAVRLLKRFERSESPGCRFPR